MNPKQLAAANSPTLWNLILAGPGSGKTTVLIERARWLLSRGVEPGDMAFVTFTNVGARVLRKRLHDAVGPVGYVGTLHAMMLRFLRQENSNWTLVPEDDANEFIQRFAQKLGYKGSAEALEVARRWIPEPSPTPAMRVIMAYQQFMREEYLLDHNMVLLEGWKLIQDRGAINPWSHWSVDEFQDSARIDMSIYMAVEPLSLTIVGDTDQAIFDFRGARAANLLDLWNQLRFTNHLLDQNYRCAEAICTLANEIIRINRNRVFKLTVSATGLEGNISTASARGDVHEAELVVDYVKSVISSGVAPEEIAVLCRTNRLANSLRNALIAEKTIPVAEVELDVKPKDWRLLLLILAQIAAPTNWALARVLAREMARIKRDDLDSAEAAMIAYRDKLAFSAAAYWSLPTLQVILSCNADFSRFGVSKASHALLADRIRLYNPANTEELIEALNASPEMKSLKGVNVMTIHAAKGEEWDTVVIPGSDMFRGKTPDEKDSERRLMFVAVTRARKNLRVVTARTRTIQLPGGRVATAENALGELYETAYSLSTQARVTTP